ncbi:hypothetical protein B7W89_19630 [Agrobacterium tumefaciens]|uniref:hypothetical protein n=1 Tax=Agrobacterium tumefaciens TaxID=358 RepID=UPI000B4041BA|nr:hypothetical protein [Agrobacterium tumefaciens]NSY03414.1 hypothetical protein [Agrobacterium tumefaciens]OVE88121.1 hypothetical protein B7W89_19630 [Agrobacterium tumefaciens]
MIPEHLAEKNLFIAICERLRWWLWFDGPRQRVIKAHGGLMPDDVREIALYYRFARNLHDDSICELIESLSLAAQQDFATLEARAEQLAGVIDSHHRLHATRFRLMSGTTKLFWFVRPDGWTPCDRLARAALRTGGQRPIDQMMHFYRRLDAIGFPQLAAVLDRSIADHGLPPLSGARVLDVLMMILGDAPALAKRREIAVAFANCLPNSMQSSLISLGEHLTEAADGGLGIEVSA